MNVEEAGFKYGKARGMNNHALKEMYKAKKLMIQLRINALINPNLSYASEVISDLDTYASKCIAELKEDKYLLKLIYKVLIKAAKKGYDTYKQEFIDLIEFVELKDKNILERFCLEYESSMYALRGITYYSGKDIPDEVDSYNEKIDAHLLTLGFIEKKES